MITEMALKQKMQMSEEEKTATILTADPPMASDSSVHNDNKIEKSESENDNAPSQSDNNDAMTKPVIDGTSETKGEEDDPEAESKPADKNEPGSSQSLHVKKEEYWE